MVSPMQPFSTSIGAKFETLANVLTLFLSPAFILASKSIK